MALKRSSTSGKGGPLSQATKSIILGLAAMIIIFLFTKQIEEITRLRIQLGASISPLLKLVPNDKVLLNLSKADSINSVQGGMMLYDYSCYPSRQHWQWNDNQTENAVIKTYNEPIVYIELAWYNLHSETFYSYIHEVCSCENKDSAWRITNDTRSTIPQFYLGPSLYVKEDLRRILAELNTTSCGPIYIGKPTVKPQLTVVTTKYRDHLICDNATSCEYLRDPRYIYICHDDAPHLEGDNASSVYWLTPLHSRYILPTFFPPTIVQQSLSNIVRKPMPRNPVFLVIGTFWDSRKRNTKSLIPVLKGTQQYNYTIKFLGGDHRKSHESFAEFLNKTFSMHNLDYKHKFELVPNTDAYEFMQHVADADVILPLVDNTNLYEIKGYMKGKKLTSSMTWAFGFQKKIVLFQQLAFIYGVLQKNSTDSYWIYDETENSFLNAFRNCLEYFGSTNDERIELDIDDT